MRKIKNADLIGLMYSKSLIKNELIIILWEIGRYLFIIIYWSINFFFAKAKLLPYFIQLSKYFMQFYENKMIIIIKKLFNLFYSDNNFIKHYSYKILVFLEKIIILILINYLIY